jgi:hypothetical protein
MLPSIVYSSKMYSASDSLAICVCLSGSGAICEGGGSSSSWGDNGTLMVRLNNGRGG